VPSFQTNNYDCFHPSVFGSFNSQLVLPLQCFHLKSTCVPHRSTVVVHFTLRSSRVSILSLRFHPECFYPKTMIYRRVSLTDRRLWYTSALRASRVSTLSLRFLLECFNPKTTICRHVSLTDRRLWFTSLFRLWEFQFSTFTFSRSAFTQRR
jgi:hypothetical protein